MTMDTDGLTVQLKTEGAGAVARKLRIAGFLLRHLPDPAAAFLWRHWISGWHLTIWARAGDAPRGTVWSRRLGEVVEIQRESAEP